MPKGLAHSFFIPYEISRVKIVSDLKRIYIKYIDLTQVGTEVMGTSLLELFKDWKAKDGCGWGSPQACSIDVLNFLSWHDLWYPVNFQSESQWGWDSGRNCNIRKIHLLTLALMEVDKEGEEENRRPGEGQQGGSKTRLKVSIRWKLSFKTFMLLIKVLVWSGRMEMACQWWHLWHLQVIFQDM